MKTLLLLFLSAISYSQTYNINALGDYSFEAKASGSIVINEKQVIVTINENIKTYDIVNVSNDVVYFSDGTMTDYFTKVSKKGKKKGKEYDTILIWNFDKRKNANVNNVLLFYTKWQQ